MKTKAAILVETGQDLVIEDLEIPVLKAGQVLVEMAYSGVCHTQLLESRGDRGEDRFLPHCLGHEGSGIVREITGCVSRVKVGDRVILSWIKGLGADIGGTVYRWGGREVNAGAVTTFSDWSVVSENRLTVLRTDIGMDQAAMLGCALPTGLGAVVNAAKAKAGESLVVFGCGGVGLCAVAGGVLRGCSPIVAVDLLDMKLGIAKQLGATVLVNASRENVLEKLQRILPGGFDHAIEATGQVGVMNDALRSVRNRGGGAVIIGNAKHGESLCVDPGEFNRGKNLKGTWGGDSLPERDYGQYEKWVSDGDILLGELMGAPMALENINEGLAGLAGGQVARPLIRLKGGEV